MAELEFTHQLSELSKSARVLNQERDSINELVEQFENTLRGMNIGVEVWVSTPFQRELAPAGNEWCTYLGWRKIAHARRPKLDWRVVVQDRGFLTEDANKEDICSPRALVDASLSVRIAALKALPELVAALKSAAAERIRGLREAKRLVEGSVSKAQPEKTAANEKIRSIEDAKKIEK